MINKSNYIQRMDNIIQELYDVKENLFHKKYESGEHKLIDVLSETTEILYSLKEIERHEKEKKEHE